MKARLALPDGRDPIVGEKACASEGVLAAFIRVLGIGNNETNVSFEYRAVELGADGGSQLLMLLVPKYVDIRLRADRISPQQAGAAIIVAARESARFSANHVR
jgi:hypothetical protein